MKIKEILNRKKAQWMMGFLLPVMLIVGYLYPYEGYLIMAMMIGFLGLSLFKGRLWCGWACPRGSFLERYINKPSLHKAIPKFMKNPFFRWAIVLIMIAIAAMQVFMAGGDLLKIGAIAVRMCIITSIIAIPIGLFYKPRTWCSFCPMGTIQGFLGKSRHLVHIDSKCKECGLCSKTCPLETDIVSKKCKVIVDSEECLRCENCVLNCPSQLLEIKHKNLS
jgi:ferredoxin-type protein NapH